MKKILFISIVSILTFNLVNSQSIEEIKKDLDGYIWGEGEGNTVRRADQQALSMLISQISVHVTSILEATSESTIVGEKETMIKDFQSAVKTYSNSTLTNARQIILSDEPNAKVFRYMKRDEIDKVFKEREGKILGFVANAEYAKANAKIADALRYYYWSLILLKSHPDGNKIIYTDKSGQDNLLTTWLPLQLNDIFSGIEISVADKETEEDYIMYTLNIKYRGQMAENFDYSYWDGMNWNNLVSARNGVGFIELFGLATESSSLQVRAEYIFKNEAKIDREIEEVLSNIEPIAFPYSNYRFPIPKEEEPIEVNSVKAVENFDALSHNTVRSNKPNNTGASKSNTEETKAPVSEKKEPAVSLIEANVEKLESSTSVGIDPGVDINYDAFSKVENEDAYRKSIELILNSIKTKNYSSTINEFTPEGYSVYEKLITYGQAKIIGTPDLNFIRFKDEVICRSVQMSFSFDSNNKQFIEDIVFYFNKESKIENLTFSLAPATLAEVLETGAWKVEERMILVNFLETYKTAYALKRLDYLDQIFNDNALIITGHIVKVAPNELNNFQGNEIVKYNQQTKQEYIKNLRRSFSSKEYINIKFEESTIVKSGDKDLDIYGIQVRQNYFSSNYGDVGYLFLLVDFTKIDEPTIWVRTWQPDTGDKELIYDLGSFH